MNGIDFHGDIAGRHGFALLNADRSGQPCVDFPRGKPDATCSGIYDDLTGRSCGELFACQGFPDNPIAA